MENLAEHIEAFASNDAYMAPYESGHQIDGIILQYFEDNNLEAESESVIEFKNAFYDKLNEE